MNTKMTWEGYEVGDKSAWLISHENVPLHTLRYLGYKAMEAWLIQPGAWPWSPKKVMWGPIKTGDRHNYDAFCKWKEMLASCF